MKLRSSSALMCALLLLCTGASAAYRCERQGKVTYSDQRCDTDHGTIVREVAPPSAASQRNSSDRMNDDGSDNAQSKRERSEVARLQALREQRERQDQQIRDLAARGAAARERKCKALALQVKWREEDLREAVLDKAVKARTRLRRANEKYQAECR